MNYKYSILKVYEEDELVIIEATPLPEESLYTYKKTMGLPITKYAISEEMEKEEAENIVKSELKQYSITHNGTVPKYMNTR